MQKKFLTIQRSGKIFSRSQMEQKQSGGDQFQRTSTFFRDHPARGEEQGNLGESGGSPPPFQNSSADDGEARNDFWFISGTNICRHHVEPRVKLHVSREESLPIPL